MKKLIMTMMLGAAFALQGALKDDIPDDYDLKEALTGQTQPGTALQNNTIYTVQGHALINAKANAGMSALKVPDDWRFLAICNGDATSLESFVRPAMRLFHGQLVYVLSRAK